MPPTNHTLTLSVMEGLFAIIRLASDAPLPAWAAQSSFFSATRTCEELSLVVPEAAAVAEHEVSRGWRMLKVRGPLKFSEVGVLAALANPLARTGVSIFVISTFDTDYLLVPQEELSVAVEALEHAGHCIANLESLFS